MNDISSRIKSLVQENKTTIPKVAQEIGVSKGTIYNIINNKTEPKKDTIIKLAKILNTTTDYLLKGDIYQNTIEEQLLDAFRELNHPNKVIAIGEVTKILTIQKLEQKKD